MVMGDDCSEERGDRFRLANLVGFRLMLPVPFLSAKPNSERKERK
ncbi:MAG: hypothetical protein RLZZ499_1098 [Cyanobacteriota bacterium]|jgi:hypothetical protein